MFRFYGLPFTPRQRRAFAVQDAADARAINPDLETKVRRGMIGLYAAAIGLSVAAYMVDRKLNEAYSGSKA